MKKAGPPRLIQSLQRATRIMDLFSDDPRPLGITEIAARVRLAKTTVQSLVQTLAHLGYLEQESEGSRYRLGPSLFRLGMRYAAGLDCINFGRPWLERLSYKYRLSVNMGMVMDANIVTVFRIESENSFIAYPQIGSHIPAHTTCIGKILLAFMDARDRKAFLSRYDFRALTANSITDPGSFAAELERTRSRELAFDEEESITGMGGIGGPVFDGRGKIAAGFAITGDIKRIASSREEIIREVRLTSLEISRQMGLAVTMSGYTA